MKPADVESYIDFDIENNDKHPKFKVGDHVRVSKYRNIFAKDYNPFGYTFVPWTNVIEDLNGGELVGTFYGNELQKKTTTNKTEFRTEKVTKKKGDTLHVKWKDYDNLFNSYIDKKICYIPIVHNQIVVQKYKVKVELELFNYVTKSGLNGLKMLI